MAKTYLDQLVEYPAKVLKRISEDKYCLGLLLNKSFNDIAEEDSDKALDELLFDYQYIDDTTQESAAYVWVEIDVDHVMNKQIKGVRLYVTIACHKGYMKLKGSTFRGVMGNRRDNLVRYIDKLLNDTMGVGGIGTLSLQSVRTLSPINGFTLREITYTIPDFNIVELEDTE